MKLVSMVVLLTLAAGAVCAAEPTALPSLTIPDCLGVNIHFSGRQQGQVDKIADAGFRFIRMDFVWGSIEAKKGEYNFRAYDELVDSLSSRGIRALFILGYGCGHYDKGLAPYTDEGRAAMAAFAKAASARYKGKGIIWELWNEPNIGFWSPKPNVRDYVKLAKAVYPAIKQGDPSCMFVTPALSNWDHGWIENAFKLGLLEYTDAITLHPYGSRKPEDGAVLISWIGELISRYAPKGRTYPIISGEWGYATHTNGVSLERQAQYLVRMFLSNTIAGCPVSIWYDWRDDGTNPDDKEHNFGTVFHDLSEKPAYGAMSVLSAELGGYTYARRLAGRSSHDYIMLLTSASDSRVAAWTTASPHTVSVELDVPSVTIVSLMGERKQVDARNGVLDLHLTGSVQYVEPSAPSRRWAAEAAWDVTGNVVFDRGVTVAKVRSRLNGMALDGALTVAGRGLARSAAAMDRGRAEVSRVFAWDGSKNPQVQVSLAVDGIDRPLVRTIELDTSACPRTEVLPPTGRDLLFEVRRPTGQVRNPFRGTLALSAIKGIGLAARSVPFVLAPSQDRTIISVGISEQPASVFSFACTMLDQDGSRIFSMPAKRYSIVETFTGGKPGDEMPGYSLELKGEDSVFGETSLSYAKAPAGGPVEVCAKLDYAFAAGWRYATLEPRAPLPIPGMPRTVKAWVKSDGSDGLFRHRMNDASGQVLQPIYGGMSFTDWRCIEAEMTPDRYECWSERKDSRMHYPASWNSLLLIDAMGRDEKGTIYIGPVMMCYD